MAMSMWGIVGLGAMLVVANAVALHQLRPENLRASAEARNAYFVHRYGERIDVAEEVAAQRTRLLIGLAVMDGAPLLLALVWLFVY